MSSRNNSCDQPQGLQNKIICLKSELKKAQSIISQQQHMLQVQKQLMDRKYSIDKVKNMLVVKLKQENMSFIHQISSMNQVIKDQSDEIEKIILINKNLKAANDQLIAELSKQQSGPTSDEKEIRIQQIRRLSTINQRPPPPPPLPLPPQKKQQIENNRKKPTRTMRQINWEAIIQQKIEKSFWVSLDDLTIKLDYEKIEQLFYQSQAQISVPQINSEIKLNALNQNLQILNQERSRAIELVIAKYKLTSQQVKLAVCDINLQYLDPEKMEALIKCLPSEKEKEQMEKVKLQSSIKLNVPERFLIELYELPYFEERLSSINFKMNYVDVSKSIQFKLNLLQSVCQALMKSTELKQFLLCCLALGNFFNINSPKGVIQGFKLDQIEKFNVLKGNDRETSFLMQAILIAEQQNIIIFNEHQDCNQLLNNDLFLQIVEASKFSLISIFNNEINQIKLGLQHLQLMFKINDQIIMSNYTTFLSEVKEFCQKIENNYLMAQKCFETFCDYFGENYYNYESEKVIQKFQNMFISIKRAKQHLETIKIQQSNDGLNKQTKTQLAKVRESIAESLSEIQQQVENVKKLPLHQILKLRKKMKTTIQSSNQD